MLVTIGLVYMITVILLGSLLVPFVILFALIGLRRAHVLDQLPPGFLDCRLDRSERAGRCCLVCDVLDRGVRVLQHVVGGREHGLVADRMTGCMVSMARSIAALSTTYCIGSAQPPPDASVPLASLTATRSAGVSTLSTPAPA